ncbi:hypothetical protein Bca52824_023778 [Brassica carinata]|uniref:Uncharacterized protein n=1 Tax=Brassica carinata TaxID=52824 RepID=A0A8X7VJ44_BRACI|nr:hypothetical protein Bca52824_023778 [Brassica carinata]
MTVGQNGALTTAVGCPTGDSDSGDHIVFELQQRSFSSLSFHHRSLSLSSFQHLSSDDGGSSSRASKLHR